MRFPLALFVIAPLLSACAGDGTPEPMALAAATSSRTLLTITAEGAGPLNGSTPYSAKAVTRALPGYTTSTIQTAVESRTVWTLTAFYEGLQVVQLHKGQGGRVASIHGVSQHLAGPAGERIGMTFSQIAPNHSACRAGRDLWNGMAICRSRSAENVKLVFAARDFEGGGGLPPAGKLARATLQRIIWTPK